MRDDGIYIFPQFLPGAVCCFSTREFEASRDLPAFLDRMGAARHPFATVEQVHGDRVIRVGGGGEGTVPLKGDCPPEKGQVPEADGIVTDEKNLALVIRSADCVPVFIFDPDTPAVGICHAGWRGVKKGIIARTLERMSRDFGSKARSMKAAMGPSICPRCYEVGGEFKNYFPGFVHFREKKHFFDLRGAVRNELAQGGLVPEAIWDSTRCTSCSVDQFYSVRKEGVQTGRLISAAMLK